MNLFAVIFLIVGVCTVFGGAAWLLSRITPLVNLLEWLLDGGYWLED